MRRMILLLICNLFLFNAVNAAEYDCERKYCKAMDSCDEAYYKLRVCDHSQLDRDNDGVPCENVCGKGGKKQSKQSKQQIKKVLDDNRLEETESEEKTDSSK